MGLMANLKAAKAYKLHGQGKVEEAKAIYEEALAGGMNDARYMLSFSVLLIRSGDFKRAREVLVKAQKAPNLSAEQKVQVFTNYAACMYKLGEIEKGIHLLERMHAKQPMGTIYQTLGYLYVEQLKDKPDPNAPAEAPEAPASEGEEGQEAAAAEDEPRLTPYEKWQKQLEKAMAFCEAACEYDDEDAICLDNLAQLYYRVLGDKEKAREYFDRAIAQKPGQIDTLWFLSRYDLEKGDEKACVEKLKRTLEGKFSVLNFISKQDVLTELKRLGENVEED